MRNSKRLHATLFIAFCLHQCATVLAMQQCVPGKGGRRLNKVHHPTKMYRSASQRQRRLNEAACATISNSETISPASLCNKNMNALYTGTLKLNPEEHYCAGQMCACIDAAACCQVSGGGVGPTSAGQGSIQGSIQGSATPSPAPAGTTQSAPSPAPAGTTQSAPSPAPAGTTQSAPSETGAESSGHETDHPFECASESTAWGTVGQDTPKIKSLFRSSPGCYYYNYPICTGYLKQENQGDTPAFTKKELVFETRPLGPCSNCPTADQNKSRSFPRVYQRLQAGPGNTTFLLVLISKLKSTDPHDSSIPTNFTAQSLSWDILAYPAYTKEETDNDATLRNDPEQMKLGYFKPYTPTCTVCANGLGSVADGCSLFNACVSDIESPGKEAACSKLLGNNTGVSPYVIDGCMSRGFCIPTYKRYCNTLNVSHEDVNLQDGAATGEEWNIWGGWKQKNNVRATNLNEYQIHGAEVGEDTWRVKLGGYLEQGQVEVGKDYNIEVNTRSTASVNIDQKITTASSDVFLYRWTNFQACKTPSSSQSSTQFLDCNDPAVTEFEDGTIGFDEDAKLYVPGRGPDVYFNVQYSGVGKRKAVFTSSFGYDFAETNNCKLRIDLGGQEISPPPICLNVADNNIIDSDKCLCINAWENLLTGGAWYAVNNTAAQVGPSDGIDSQEQYYPEEIRPYGTQVETTIGCAKFTYPEPPTNIQVLSKTAIDIELQWSIDSYDKGGRFIPAPYQDDTYVPVKHISTLLTTVQVSSTSATSGFMDVAAIDPLPYWCAVVAIDPLPEPRVDAAVSSCRKCATNLDCLPGQICNVEKIVLDSQHSNYPPGTHWDFPFCGADTYAEDHQLTKSYCSEYHKFKECRPRNKRTVKLTNLNEATKYWVRFQIKNDANLSSTWSDPLMVETTCPDGTMLPVTACSCGLANTFPAGFCNCESTQTYDACNVCNGPGIDEGKCDCNNNVNDICGVCGGSGIPIGFCDCNKNIQLPNGRPSSYCDTLISLTNLQQDGAGNDGGGSGDNGGSSSAGTAAKCSTITAFNIPSLATLCSGGSYTGQLKTGNNNIDCVGSVCGTVDKATCCANPTPYTEEETEERLSTLSNFTSELNDDVAPTTKEELDFNKYVRETVITAVIETIPPENPNSTDASVWELIGATASKPEELSLDSSEDLAKQTSEAFDVAKTEKRPVAKKTIDLATSVVANVEKALYEEKVKAAGVDSTGGDGGGGSSSAENKKIIANTQKIALNLIKSADEISNVVAFSLLSNNGGGGGGDISDITFNTPTFDLQVSKKQPNNVLGSVITVGGGEGNSNGNSPDNVQFQLPSSGLTFDDSTYTEFHSVLWARNPFTYFEPSYDANTSQWYDDSLNFPVASLRLRQYNSSGDANDVAIYNLPEPITITFPYQQSYDNATGNQNVNLVCVWWHDQLREWSGDGCGTPIVSTQGVVQCECTHLTNFAVRLKKAAKQNVQILKSITSERFGQALLNNPVALVFVISVCTGSLLLFLFGLWYHRRKKYKLKQRVLLLHKEFEHLRASPLRSISVSYEQGENIHLDNENEDGKEQIKYDDEMHASAVSFVTDHQSPAFKRMMSGGTGAVKDGEEGVGENERRPSVVSTGSDDQDMAEHENEEQLEELKEPKAAQSETRQNELRQLTEYDPDDVGLVVDSLDVSHVPLHERHKFNRGKLDSSVSQCMTTIDELLEQFAVDQGRTFVKTMEKTMSVHSMQTALNKRHVLHRRTRSRRPSSIGRYVREFYGKSSHDLIQLVHDLEMEERDAKQQRLDERKGNEAKQEEEDLALSNFIQGKEQQEPSTTIEVQDETAHITATAGATAATAATAQTTAAASSGSALSSKEKKVTTAGSIVQQYRSDHNKLTVVSVGLSNLSTMDWMWMRSKQSLEIEHEWIAPFFAGGHEMGFYTLPSRILVWACIVLGQFVIESFVYNIRYPEHAQNCTVYNDFSVHNISLGTYNSTLWPNGTTTSAMNGNFTNSSNGLLTLGPAFVPMKTYENFMLAILVTLMSLPLPMLFFNINIAMAKSMRNARVFEFAGIVGLAKLREFQKSTVRIVRNDQCYGDQTPPNNGREGGGSVKELTMRGSSGCAYLTDDDERGKLNTYGTMTICCSTETFVGQNGPPLPVTIAAAEKQAQEKKEQKEQKEQKENANDNDNGEPNESKILNASDSSDLDEEDEDEEIPLVSYTLVIVNKKEEDNAVDKDVLELHFSNLQERDNWKRLIDDLASKSLSSDSSTMLECETAEGCYRELKKRYGVLKTFKGNYGLVEKYKLLFQRCEEWLHHARLQREHASVWLHNDLEEDQEKARKKFKHRVMQEQAVRDELEERLTQNTWFLSRFIFNTLSSAYQHKLEPPIRDFIVTFMHVFMYIYIVICSIWLMLFSVCNGSEKSWNWLVSNFIMVGTSALFVRPVSLLMVNVVAPVVCLKFDLLLHKSCVYCCGLGICACDGSKNERKRSHTHGDGRSAAGSTTGTKNTSPKKDQRGSYQTTHKKGLYHAPSFGGGDNDDGERDDVVMFHLHTRSALSRGSNASTGSTDVVMAMVDTETGEDSTSPAAAVGREIEMIEVK